MCSYLVNNCLLCTQHYHFLGIKAIIIHTQVLRPDALGVDNEVGEDNGAEDSSDEGSDGEGVSWVLSLADLRQLHMNFYIG